MAGELSKMRVPRPRVIIAAAALVVVFFAGLYAWKRARHAASPAAAPEQAEISPARPPDLQRMAVLRVEEDRGQPTGNKAEIEVPAELKLYKDRRRFLAIQVAEAREQKYDIPEGFADLAEMTRRGEFVTLPDFGADYILYGVGLSASDELTYFDPKTLKSVPLFASQAEAEAELARLDALLAESETKVGEWRDELAKLKRTERAARKEIEDRIGETQKSSADVK